MFCEEMKIAKCGDARPFLVAGYTAQADLCVCSNLGSPFLSIYFFVIVAFSK